MPKPIKLQQQHRLLMPLDKPLTEETGRALGEWAAGGTVEPDPAAPELPELITELLRLADQLGQREATTGAIGRNRQRHSNNLAAHADWLRKQIAGAQDAVAKANAAPEEDLFSNTETPQPQEA